jgi:hypothetical protein
LFVDASAGNANVPSIGVLRWAMLDVTLLAFALFLVPLIRTRKQSETRQRSASLQGCGYFAAIGSGFMLLENMLIQRFVLYLGHPSYAVSVVLASLLLGMGLGAANATRVGIVRLQRLGFLAPLLLLAFLVGLPYLMETTLVATLGWRMVMAAVLLLPLGMMLGLFLPLGILRFGATTKPWYWAINGAFGVVVSVFSLALSMDFGFDFVGYLSVLFYLIAWLCAQRSLGQVERDRSSTRVPIRPARPISRWRSRSAMSWRPEKLVFRVHDWPSGEQGAGAGGQAAASTDFAARLLGRHEHVFGQLLHRLSVLQAGPHPVPPAPARRA